MDKLDQRNRSLGHSARRDYTKRLRSNFLSILYTVLIYAFLCAVVLMEIRPDTIDIQVGQLATETLTAIVAVEDPAGTVKAREEAAAQVPEEYVASPKITAEALSFFENTVFGGLRDTAAFGENYRAEHETVPGEQISYPTDEVDRYVDDKMAFLKNRVNLSGSVRENVIKVMNVGLGGLDELQQWFSDELTKRMNAGISKADRDSKRATFLTDIRAQEGLIPADRIYFDIICVMVMSDEGMPDNYVVDEEATQRKRDEAAAAVKTVKIEKDEVIVREGEVITENHYVMLQNSGLLSFPVQLFIATFGIVLLMLMMVIGYVGFFEKHPLQHPKKMLLLDLLIAVDIVVCLIFKRAGWPFMMNTAAATILVAVFLDQQLGFVVNAALSVIVAMIFGKKGNLFDTGSISLLLSCFVGGSASVFVCSRVRSASRGKMLLPGFASGAAGMVTCFLIMYSAGKSLEDSAISGAYVLGGGVVTALFTVGSMSLWESAFNMLTQSKLLELSNSGSDLLRKVSLEIPGTYQHSVTVATLAENAAKDIGANALLARAAALYHDIGKIRTPECYTENQTPESKNFHDTLSPQESARMIFSHITEGVKLAKENKLPQEIVDVIRQHHGTSAVMYFYNRAREADPEVRLEDFRYPGPNPQTKEAGIILMADCIEASVRSMDEKTQENLTAQIERMFKARIEDGELDDCDLSLKDINVIKQSFLTTLTAVYHGRIKYDTGAKKE